MKSTSIEFKVKPWFTKACDYLWYNRKNIQKKYDQFDYPDYCGLPKNIAEQLTGDFVDLLQGIRGSDIFQLLKLKSKKQFVKAILDAVIESGYYCDVFTYTVK